MVQNGSLFLSGNYFFSYLIVDFSVCGSSFPAKVFVVLRVILKIFCKVKIAGSSVDFVEILFCILEDLEIFDSTLHVFKVRNKITAGFCHSRSVSRGPRPCTSRATTCHGSSDAMPANTPLGQSFSK